MFKRITHLPLQKAVILFFLIIFLLLVGLTIIL